MTAPQKLAQLIINDPERATRVANLLVTIPGLTITRAIRITHVADAERTK